MKVYDDRWGVFVNQCQLGADHDGDHRVTLSACDPTAYLGWTGSAHGDGSEGG